MSITVKYFAGLRERCGRSTDIIDYQSDMTVADVWKQTLGTQQIPADNLKVAVNMEYTRGDARLNDGDEVAFFPSVTGG